MVTSWDAGMPAVVTSRKNLSLVFTPSHPSCLLLCCERLGQGWLAGLVTHAEAQSPVLRRLPRVV